ncbi:MAG: CHAT domain-containing protein, partial [Nitrospirota bacterium]|nr:CHAT domain-containing protein [Nitrospirota bacterium]
MKKRREKPASGTRAENGEKNVGIFRLRGAVDSVVEGSVLNTRAVKLSPKGIFRAGPSRSGEKLMTVDVAGDDLIEVEFDGGERLWINGEDFQKQFGKSVGREVTPDGAVTLVPSGLQLLPSGMEARGPINWVVKGLKVFGVDLAGKTAIDIAKTVEGRTSAKRPAPGLYSCSLKTGDFRLAPVVGEQPETKEAFLVFIHGTMSSTWGSFGDLWSEERSRELADLNQAYGDRVLAFEHAYLTKSPIENARDLTRELARVLPERAKVHLVTHSRGGLVGELLCRGGAKSPFSEEELNLFDQNEEYKESAKLLSELNEELLKRRFQVERFVRVACPALGTTLASQRLDRWLSVIGTVGSAALPNTPLGDAFADIGDFIAAVVQERTDPRTLPGLEAMMPESAFIKLVNWAEAMVPGDLTVIAGDIDPDKWWARLMVWLTDRFYAGDHDLVVNTPSMYGGVKRLGKSLAAFHKGPDVCHFNYFQNRESATQLVQALKGDTKDFEPLERPTVDIAREIVSRLEGPMPVLFVLPGIMGSELSVKGKEIWADIPKLLLGGFADLDIGAKKVEPTNVMARYYGALIKRLATTHKVVPFPYDWRLPVEKEAERLAAKVRSELDEAKRNRQPVRILAHSMGGLVARTMIALNDPLWKDICTHDGARLVMLGTPNGGSHAITELLVGQSSMMRNIALLDIAHSQKELLRHASRFPGVLAMLPKDSGEDYFSPSTWMAYHRQAGDGWVLPTDDDLKKAGEFRALLDNGAVDPRRMIYVAGCADVTLAGMHLDENAEDPDERIKFTATTRGDGRVTWDSGIPKDIPTWYMDAEHGDLPAHEEAFDAIEELLTRGTTTLLPQTPPVSRAAVAVTFPRPRAADELYPDRDCLIANALGARPRKYRRSVSRKLPVRVSVAHGNLAFASHPVATGHYAGDTIISAEYYLDRELSGALTRRHQLGIYPGAVETNAVFINPKLFIKKDVGLKGAIVVGLGPVGGLSAASLTRSFARALLEYVTEWRERGPCSEGNEAGQKEFNVTSLLIGTGAAGISVNDSIFALLHGVARANQALANSRQDARISEVEFIELWEDRAIQAVKALQRLQAEPRFRTAFVCDTTLRALEGGLRRVEYAEPEGWWDRLQILGGGKHGEPAGGTLRFSALTQRARSEVRLLATQRELVDSFIEQSVLTTQDNRTAARTLFELLLPNEIKDQAPDQDNLIMVVDEDAARYPWELMEDPAHNSGVPFVIEHGLLRQLESTEFRETVREVTDKTALVIGDPVSKYVELRGAQAEARAVWKLLQSGKFTAEQRMRPTADQVMNALYSRPWRILHLAGHGIYNYLRDDLLQCEECKQPMPPAEEGKRRSKLRPVTGMIIGDTAVLSPQEVHQMRHVPELVFINCCHLGKIESTSGDKELNDRRDFNRIAANVATEFIRMGVRAVVAAGWAVDDAAATVFATTFYGAMLRGDGFGDAVRQARAEVYKQHPGTNTWGAYQCYGDPDYRLVRLDDSTVKNEVKPSYVAVTQAVTDIENVAAELSAMADGDVGAKIKRLEKIKEVLAEKRWLDEGGVSVAFARAYGKAKEFDSAIEYYKKSLGAEDGSMT